MKVAVEIPEKGIDITNGNLTEKPDSNLVTSRKDTKENWIVPFGLIQVKPLNDTEVGLQDGTLSPSTHLKTHTFFDSLCADVMLVLPP